MSLFDEDELNASGTGCYACRLRNKCKHPMLKPSGSGRIPLLIIGNRPIKGKHFNEDCYSLLETVLKKEGINIEQCRYMSAISCSTPENREPQPREVELCRSSVWSELRERPARAILLLGDSALLSVLSTRWKRDLGNSQRWEGLVIPDPKLKSWIVVTRHPESLIPAKDKYKDPALEKIWKKHLALAVDYLDKPFPKTMGRYPGITHLLGDRRIPYLEALLENQPEYLAFDYETNCISPYREKAKIYSVSFATDNNTGVAMPFDEKIAPLFKQIMLNKNIGKIASNMKFEDMWTRAVLHHTVKNWVHDTMLCAHVEDGRERYSGLKTQVFLWFGIPDYAEEADKYLTSTNAEGYNNIHMMKLSSLLEYNGLDSVFEFRLAMEQIKAFI